MNVLVPSRRRAVLACLVEGCSIRATSRLTGVAKKTIMRLLVEAGEHCELLLSQRLRDLPCSYIEADEIWTYVRKKQGNLGPADDDEAGDQYTFLALDPLSKLIAAHVTGRRNIDTATDFITLVRDRIPGRLELFTDGWPVYVEAIDEVFDERTVHFAQVIKPQFGAGLKIVRQFGGPNPDAIGTSYVERQNATLRQQVRRFTRKTMAFSKKLRNLQAAVSLYVAWYNWCRKHGSLGMTPAMALGIAGGYWSIDRLLP